MVVEVSELRQQSVTLLEQIDELDADKLNDYIEKYNKLVDRKKEVNQEISVATTAVEANNSKIEVFKHELVNIGNQIKTYEQNQEAIENLEALVSKRNEYVLISRTQKACSTCKEELNELYKLHGSYEQKLQNLADQKQELADLREEYSAYDLFMRCMHTSGISYDIIKKKAPSD